MNRWSALALLLAVAVALALRCPGLGIRPLHNDEAVNAVKLSALSEKGEFKYDPHEFHGPTLYYLSLPFLWLGSGNNPDGLTDANLRVVTVAFGVALVLLLLLLGDGLGRSAMSWAAIFVAVSPAMVFYSRYFIHEMLLVFFTLLTLAAAWRYTRTRGKVWAALSGSGVGLMFATKETFVFSVVAMALAAAATLGWTRWRARQTAPGDFARQNAPGNRLRECWSPSRSHVALAGTTAAMVWLVLFSSFFKNWIGLLDSIRTFLTYVQRAGGAGPHLHPWHFYFDRLLWFHQPKGPVWSEGLILILAAVGALVAFFSNRTILASPGFARFIAFYTLILTTMYCVISYKTPWCALNFLLGTILLAGIGAAALIRLCQKTLWKSLVAAVLVAGASHLAWEAWHASQTHASDRRNPYVYSQTLPDLLRLVERVEAISRVSPSGHETVVKVISPDSYWPLPWYLRAFTQIGWWEQLPPDPYAPMIITSAKLHAQLDEKSSKGYLMTGLYELRPGIFLELYIETELWKQFVATLPREPE